MTKIAIALFGPAFAAWLVGAAAAEPLKLDFSNDRVGGDATSFVNVVGVWRVESEGDNKVLDISVALPENPHPAQA